MDRVFDHEDPNNSMPEEIPMDDLGSYDEENYDDEYFDAHDLDMMETTFSGGTEMFDKEGRPITPLANS